ncbi:acyltransferase [Candidatus Saccharibacteria bacterium]|nr:acyltransferase [Candidatus Saccharibacteria bacterium]
MKRNSVVDLLRFIACCFIMWFHTPLMRYGVNTPDFHFTGAFIFVEFFFILMGNFTFKHFQTRPKPTSIEEKAKRSLVYTWRKFSKYLPYTMLAVVLAYIIKLTAPSLLFETRTDVLLFFKNFLAEFFLLNARSGGQYGVIWYLAAAVVVFPLFGIICQTKKKHLLYSALIPFCTIYYLIFRTSSGTDEGTITRAFAGLCLGILVYALSERIRKYNYKKYVTAALSFVELLTFMIAIALLYTKNRDIIIYDYIYSFNIILCFFISSSLLLSQKTYQSQIDSKVFRFLGMISFQMYLYHQLVHLIINNYLSHLPAVGKVAILYVGTFMLSVAIYLIVEKIRRRLPPARVLLLEKEGALAPKRLISFGDLFRFAFVDYLAIFN